MTKTTFSPYLVKPSSDKMKGPDKIKQPIIETSVTGMSKSYFTPINCTSEIF